MISIKDFSVAVDAQPIVHNVTLSLGPGTHVLIGPNGSGKSTLMSALVGHPRYTVTSGAVCVDGQDITHLPADARARLRMLLAFQHPVEIPGVTLFQLLYQAYQVCVASISITEFQVLVQDALLRVGLDYTFVERAHNVGFSGGERKRAELLQLLVLQPNILMLDELDSGMDVDAVNLLVSTLALAKVRNPKLVVLVISHYEQFIEKITPDTVHLMRAGRIVQSGTVLLAKQMSARGYQSVP